MQSFILFLVVAVAYTQAAVIPTYKEPCKKSDPKLNECILNAIKTFIPAVAKEGARDIGVPALDPFYMAEQLITYKNKDIDTNVLLKNIFVHGASKATFKAVRANFDNPEKVVLEADMHFPKIFTEGTYKMDGKIGTFVLNGRGVYNMTIFDVNDTVVMEAKIVKIEGEEFLKATKVTSTPQIGDIKVYFSNLINGNPELSAMANQFINQFWRLFYQEALPVGQEYFDKISRAIVNKALLTIPYKQLIAQ